MKIRSKWYFEKCAISDDQKVPDQSCGDKAYPISLWNSWDGDSGLSNVVELVK